MQWTQEQYEEFSRKVAEKYTIKDSYGLVIGISHKLNPYPDVWIYQSWHDLMELSVIHSVEAQWSHDDMSVAAWSRLTLDINDKIKVVKIADHNNDKSLAERVARMLALLEVEL